MVGVDTGVDDGDVGVDAAGAVARHGAGPLAVDPVNAGGQPLRFQVDRAVGDHSGHAWVGVQGTDGGRRQGRAVALDGRAVDEPDPGVLRLGLRVGDRGGLATKSFSTRCSARFRLAPPAGTNTPGRPNHQMGSDSTTIHINPSISLRPVPRRQRDLHNGRCICAEGVADEYQSGG